MKRTEPEVFLICKPQVDWEGVSRYLKTIDGEEWLGRCIVASDAEGLVEFGGRLCYRSWEPGLNPNVTKVRQDSTKYLENIVNVGHGSVTEHAQFSFVFKDLSRVACYAPGTEVFTSTGWKVVEDLRIDDRLLTLNPKTRMASFGYSKSVRSFDFEGDLVWWETAQMKSPKVTPDHLLWCARYDLRRNRGKSNSEISETASKTVTSEVFGKRIVIDHKVALCEEQTTFADEETKIGDRLYPTLSLFEWLGWIATDGGFQKDRPHQVSIYQSKDENLAAIETVMDTLFGGRWRRHGPYGGGKQLTFTISDPDIAEFASDMLGRKKPARSFHPDLLTADETAVQRFLDSAIAGDGNVHKDNGHEVIYCQSIEAAGQYQFLFSRVGKTANVRTDDRTGNERMLNGSVIRNNVPIYVVSVCRKTATMICKRGWRKERYSGKVYCPETEDGIVLVRREGLPMWNGNTHEIARHRVGCAISQESLRYVRLTDLSVWFPDALTTLPDGTEPMMPDGTTVQQTVVSVVEQLEELQGSLAKAFKLDDEGVPFEYKKAVTSAMRRLAPIGLATTMLWSANVRTLRHVIEMRTSRHAEQEVRLIFNQVGNIMLEEAPSLFSDYKREPFNGIDEWTTESSKI